MKLAGVGSIPISAPIFYFPNIHSLSILTAVVFSQTGGVEIIHNNKFRPASLIFLSTTFAEPQAQWRNSLCEG